MLKKLFLGFMCSFGISSVVMAGDITSTGKSDADVYTYYSNIKTNVNNLMDRAKSQCLTSAGLFAVTGSSTVKTTVSGSTTALCNGVLVQLGSSTVLPVLVGDIGTTAGRWKAYSFFVDSTGAKTTTASNGTTTLGGIVLASIPASNAMLGCLIVYNGSNTTFLPGTHTLDAGSITTTFVNTQGMIDVSPGTTLSLTGL